MLMIVIVRGNSQPPKIDSLRCIRVIVPSHIYKPPTYAKMLYGIRYDHDGEDERDITNCILITDSQEKAEQFVQVIQHGNGYNLPSGDNEIPRKYNWKLRRNVYIPQRVRVFEINVPINELALGQSLYLQIYTHEITLEERPITSWFYTP